MRSIRVYLFGLVATCLALAALAFAMVVFHANRIARQQAEAQAQETATALSQTVDRELGRAMGVLAALSTSQAADQRDWPVLDHQARAALQDKNAWIVVHDRTGKQWVNTRLPVGASLPSAPPPTAMWSELRSGKPRVCNLASGQVERNIVCVDAPMGAGPLGDYAISMIFVPQAFDAIIRRNNGSPGNIATLVDRNGKVIWRNINPERFVGRPATGKMARALASGAKSGAMESQSLDGVEMLSAFKRSDLSGWSVIVGSPLTQVNSFSRQAMWRGSVLALAIFVLAAILATLLGARIASAIKALVRATEPETAGGQGATGIAEIDSAANALRASYAARAESERHQQMLVGELNHRVKNTLAIVQSLAHQTFRGNASPGAAISAFEARLQALAGAHNLLTSQKWESASMRQIVDAALRPFCTSNRCEVVGPDVQLLPQTAVSLALAVHELATNASKYGALSNDAGKIHLSWSADSGSFLLLWEERDGPEVEPPAADGFGMRLLKRSLASEVQGTAEVEFARTGLRCRLVGKLDQPAAS